MMPLAKRSFLCTIPRMPIAAFRTIMRLFVLGWMVTCGVTVAGPAPTPTPSPKDAAEASYTDPGSPRASVKAFLSLANREDFAGAAQYLDLPPGFDGPLTARRLKAVLDRHIWIDLKTLSPNPEGADDDNLPPGIDEIGTIPGPRETAQPIRLVRKERPAGPIWVFSKTTVSRVDWWYEHLPDRWLRERIPAFFFRMGFKGLVVYQWVAVLLLFPVLFFLARAVTWGIKRVLLKAAAKTATGWDDALVRGEAAPFSLALSLFFALLGLPLLGLNSGGDLFLHQVLTATAIFCAFWIVYRGAGVAGEILSGSEWVKTNPSAPAVLSLGLRSAKVVTIVLGVLAAAAHLGVPVSSALAGLGLGGLAFALAAQKTVENLFGSVSIGVDQPFRIGDFINVGGLMGTVEGIGLRSTRIRTLDRTLVTVPNGKLADRDIETFAARDRFRLFTIIGLEYRTTQTQMTQVLDGFRSVLNAHPNIWPDVVTVRFQQFGQSSLDVEVVAWFLAKDFEEFKKFREEVLLQFMSVVEAAGTGFAFPTRTLHIAQMPKEVLRRDTRE